MFNVKHKFVYLQFVCRQILFSENHTFCKQKRTAVYRRASLVSAFKVTRKNDDLPSSRQK